MARKRYPDEDGLKVLREIEVHLHDGLEVVSARPCSAWQRSMGVMGCAK